MSNDPKDITPPTDRKSAKEWLTTAQTLTEALPFLLRYDKQTVVIKYGGHAMGDEALARNFARDLVLVKQVGINPVVVHGGGPQIASMLERLNIKSDFVEGLRVSDAATVEVVEMVLAGKINKQIVSSISREGGRAIGLSGKDGNMIIARKLHRKVRDPDSNIERLLDLGFVGEPATINTEVLDAIIEADLLPVIAPIGISAEGDTYNINADTAAGAIAGALNAKRLILLTDVPGVLDAHGNPVHKLSLKEARALINDGTIDGGMIPKIETCIDAINQGVEAVVILDGRVPHALLLELFTDQGAGTLIS
jgi:acetylglutamate kinase